MRDVGRPTVVAALAVAAGLLIAYPAAAAPAARVASGVLSAASRRPPEAVTRDFLAERPDLRGGVATADLVVQPSRRLSGGALTLIEQRHRGLAVLGASAAVRTDRDGRVRWSRSSLRALPDLPRRPRLSVDDALRAAGVEGATAATVRAELEARSSRP